MTYLIVAIIHLIRCTLQRILGPYGQYQSAIEMETSEQMYGIAEPSATSREGSSRSSQVVSLPADHKRDKVKKKQRTTKLEKGSQSLGDPPGTVLGRKKVSVRPYNKSSQQSASLDAANNEIHLPHFETDTKDYQSKLPCGLPANSFPTQPPSTVPSIAPSVTVKARKKLKKQKRNNSHTEETPSEHVAPSISIKPRPEALNIAVSESSSFPGQSDGPDTGDVRHMLHELLHPPPVSLVTPILTPSKVQPFTFPTSATHTSVRTLYTSGPL